MQKFSDNFGERRNVTISSLTKRNVQITIKFEEKTIGGRR